MPSRRDILRAAAGLGIWGGVGLPGLAFAVAPTEKRLMLVVLRGGMDGLAAFPPYGDASFAQVREALAPRPPGEADGVLDLDGFFGMHPALAPLHPLYRRGEFLLAHAMAIPLRSRSHFNAQDVLENGAAGLNVARDGWLNRAVGALGQDDRRLGLAVGYGVPLVLQGAVPVTSWAPAQLPVLAPDFMTKIALMFEDYPLFANSLAEGLRAQILSERVMRYRGPKNPRNLQSPRQFTTLAEAAGRLMAAADGPRIAVVEMGGWDTHRQQGATGGRIGRNLGFLAEGLAALPGIMGPAWKHTVVLAVTEFGRTAMMNGSAGTDHGTAGAGFLMGGAVAGGRVLADWPGLDHEALYEGRDLAPTLDMRGLFKAVLRDHLGIGTDTLDATVFPDGTGVKIPNGLIRG